MEERLDKILVERGLVTSRTRGEELIRNGDVLVNGLTVDKPGKKISLDAKIILLNEEMTWVSRGALKLLKALESFSINPKNQIFIDLGASTGGFTEVLLSKDVAKVYCVDVGHDQLHERIKSNPKIVNLEKTHVRELNNHVIPELVDGIVIDVSFISLTKVLPFLTSLLKPNGKIIALVKPQFEVERKQLNKHGIVRSSSSYPKVIDAVKRSLIDCQLDIQDLIDSPITGGDGNKEFLLWAIKK